MAAPQALIKDLEGEVNVSRNGEIVAVKAGDYLMPGDEVVTGANGRLALEFPGSDGQIPAAGVMTANGKLTLGEQTGSNGQQQIVVLEDGECFEFTTELAENSAAAEGGAVAGVFGAGLLGAVFGGWFWRFWQQRYWNGHKHRHKQRWRGRLGQHRCGRVFFSGQPTKPGRICN